MKLLKGLFLLIAFTSSARAADFEISSSLEEKRNFLSASYENSNFKLSEAEIKGSGIKVAFNHAFSSLNLEMYLSTALNSEKSVQSSFTGLGSYIYYSILGNCCSYGKNYRVNGMSVVSENSQFRQDLQIGLGIDQYLLNGSKAVYSASGLGLAMTYDFSLFDWRFRAGARYSTMTASQNSVKGNFYSFGMVFPL